MAFLTASITFVFLGDRSLRLTISKRRIVGFNIIFIFVFTPVLLIGIILIFHDKQLVAFGHL